MAHYAKIENGIVTDVIVAEYAFIQKMPRPNDWLKTSYNTRGGIHYGPDGNPDGGVALRKNYAMIGYSYNSELDAFIPPKIHSGWTLNTETCLWEPPIPAPDEEGKKYIWSNETESWIEV